jgi:ribosomal protein S18 acetylase RimI-like enzyme
MLGVDPEFGGRGIASELVKKGVDQAQKANLPAYTESTPAAVRVYANQGFKELGRKEVLEDGSYYFTAMLRMPEANPAIEGLS